MTTFREASKQEYNSRGTTEDLNAGSLQRIADATEKMASNYVRMESDLQWYKEKFADKNKEIDRLGRVIAGLRGHIKRIKNLKSK